MKVPFKPAVRGLAAHHGLRGCNGHLNASSTELLMTTTGKIFLANYDGAKFDVTMNTTVTGAPTWVHHLKPNKLFAVDENGTEMRLFHLDRAGNGSSVLSEPVASVNGSTGVVHLGFNKDNTRMVAPAYGNGTIDIWDISGDKLELLHSLESRGNPGPKKPNQEKSHPHQAVLDPSGGFFVVNDLGTDTINIIDTKSYEISGDVSTDAGCGPRHGVFHPQNGDKATHYFVACEISNEIISYKVAYDNGISLTKDASVSTYVAGKAPSEKAAAGEIAIHPNGKDLYVSNRLTGAASDNIAHFKIGQDGKLEIQKEVATGGVLPRMFSLNKAGTTLFVGNQNGPVAAAAIAINSDGSLAGNISASLNLDVFGEEGFGPPYIQQI